MRVSVRSVILWCLLLAGAAAISVMLAVRGPHDSAALRAAMPAAPQDWHLAMPELRDRLLKAAAAPDAHEFSGVYRTLGNGFSSGELLLVPQKGFVYEERTDAGPAGRAFGRVAPAQDGWALQIDFEQDVMRDPRLPAPQGVLYPLRWGERRYLVETERLAEFVRAVNFGAEPRSELAQSRFLLRKGDEYKPVTGAPLLPAWAAALLRETPVQARITAIEFADQRVVRVNGWPALHFRYRVELSGGRYAGLLPGMQLQSQRDETFSELAPLVVESVSDTAAVALLQDWMTLDEYPGPPAPPGEPREQLRAEHPARVELMRPVAGEVYTSGGLELARRIQAERERQRGQLRQPDTAPAAQ